MRVVGALGGGDHERQVRRAVGRTELDLGAQPCEGEGVGVDGCGAAVRNGDPAAEPGDRLLLTGEGVCGQTGRIGPSGLSDESCHRVDDLRLGAAEVCVQQDELGCDERFGQGRSFSLGGHSGHGGQGQPTSVTMTAEVLSCSGRGSAVPAREAAAEPYATASRSRSGALRSRVWAST